MVLAQLTLLQTGSFSSRTSADEWVCDKPPFPALELKRFSERSKESCLPPVPRELRDATEAVSPRHLPGVTPNLLTLQGWSSTDRSVPHRIQGLNCSAPGNFCLCFVPKIQLLWVWWCFQMPLRLAPIFKNSSKVSRI